jgi:CDP-diacylglycerol--glycerol-3-phosphate 3-phosphatidyltransferase
MSEMIKYIPNILSSTRIFLVVLLLVLTLFVFEDFALSLPFLVIYTIAGITDMIDGPIARKFNVTSPLGANLDGIADYFFVVVALVTIIPALNFNAFSIAIVIGFVILKVAGMIVGYIHYKQLMMMHTYLSKAGAMFAFLFPLVHAIYPYENTILIFLGAYVYLFLVEEIAINIVMPEPKRDIKGIFQAIEIRRQINSNE